MAWLDDRIWAHPKIRDVPRATRWEYAAAIAYSSGFGTKGILTAGQLRAIECRPNDRKLLIEVGLWIDQNDGAIRINDWDEHNGKRDARRESDRARKRADRAKTAKTSAGQGADSPQNGVRTQNERPQDVLARARRRPPDDGSDRVTEEGLTTESAAGVQGTSSTSESHYAETEQPGDPAAAVESPTESDIRDACTRFGADLNVVEPVARQLPGAIFAAVVMKHTAKVARGSAREVPALFVDLLKRELKDQAKAVAKTTRVMPPTRLPEDERPVKVEGEDWVRHIVPTLTRHPFERVAALIDERAEAEDWTPAELEQRQHLALELHQAEAA